MKKGPAGPFVQLCVFYALLPSMRVILVPHTGQGPCAAMRPFGRSFFSPSNSRLALHFTQ